IDIPQVYLTDDGLQEGLALGEGGGGLPVGTERPPKHTQARGDGNKNDKSDKSPANCHTHPAIPRIGRRESDLILLPSSAPAHSRALRVRSLRGRRECR